MSSLFEVFKPQGKCKGLISIPHSGEQIPEIFEDKLVKDSKIRNRDVDTAVDKLIDIDQLTSYGIHILVANIHRTCIDLNRRADRALLTWKSDSFGNKLVSSEFSQAEAGLLLQKYRKPYYSEIESLLTQYRGIAFVDLHSMPSKATDYHLSKNPNQEIDRPDFCLSDFKAQSAPVEYCQFLKSKLEAQSFIAKINDPYHGGNITQYFGELSKKTIQIEINRKLYLNEDTKILLEDKIPPFKTLLTKLLIEYFEKFSG